MLATRTSALRDLTFFVSIEREWAVVASVRDKYPVIVLASSEKIFDNDPEFLICEINLIYTKLLFADIYRRPHASYPFHFFNCLSTFLSSTQL